MSIRRPTDSEDRETLAMPEVKSPPDTRPTDLAVFFNKVFSSLAHFHEDGTPIAPSYLGEGGVWARPYDGGRQTLQRILGSDGSTLTDSELWWMGSDGISFPVGYARNLPSEVTSFNQLTKTGVYWFTPLTTGGPDYISSGNVWVQQGSLEGRVVYYQIIYGSDAVMSFRQGTRISVDVVQWGEWQADALAVAKAAQSTALAATPTGDIRLLPFRFAELPFGWHFCNGDLYPLDSAVGQALNNLSDNYKSDWGIVEGGETISIPNMYYSDGRGYFMRAATVPGGVVTDAMQRIQGTVRTGGNDNNSGSSGVDVSLSTGAFAPTGIARNCTNSAAAGTQRLRDFSFDNDRVVRTATETRPLYRNFTPAIFLGV